MKRSGILIAGLGMLLLILDSRCAAQSVQSALDLCLKTVIPSLFPMFVLTGRLVSGIGTGSGKLIPLFERQIKLPRGTGNLFLLGVLGGFPVGAQCIAQAVETHSLSKTNGEQMLGFCNNCSPAFLFGIVGSIFPDKSVPLMIFLIQLESALLIAAFTDFDDSGAVMVSGPGCTFSDTIARSVRSMVSVCAWVVLAGVVTGFLKRWIYPLLPLPVPQLLTGLLEITGGILGLAEIPAEEVRFVLCAAFVCFGGFSVWMQIQSLVSSQSLSTAVCFRQKTIQGILGGLLALSILAASPMVLAIPPILILIRKKRLEKPTASVYNDSHKGGLDHVVP